MRDSVKIRFVDWLEEEVPLIHKHLFYAYFEWLDEFYDDMKKD